MDWNKHSDLKGTHALLSASKYHWLNYDEEKLLNYRNNYLAIEKGTKMHEFAENAIKMGIKLAKSQGTIAMYVNDAIAYNMQPEVVLYYTEDCYGTADAISFEDNVLRVFDLKTGKTKANMKQLLIYVSLFCLEYMVSPFTIEIECRIYQSSSIKTYKPVPEEIIDIMNKIEESVAILEKAKVVD